ncbi:MAG: hypothetical protein NZT61_03985 [Deltaproteobacteria bacterium]|nr:hypothetical protein [Deltaproteobacteria bacterium]MCX7953084.1 hypothetical protein [Deltaproteobacteria bacterium]
MSRYTFELVLESLPDEPNNLSKLKALLLLDLGYSVEETTEILNSLPTPVAISSNETELEGFMTKLLELKADCSIRKKVDPSAQTNGNLEDYFELEETEEVNIIQLDEKNEDFSLEDILEEFQHQNFEGESIDDKISCGEICVIDPNRSNQDTSLVSDGFNFELEETIVSGTQSRLNEGQGRSNSVVTSLTKIEPDQELSPIDHELQSSATSRLDLESDEMEKDPTLSSQLEETLPQTELTNISFKFQSLPDITHMEHTPDVDTYSTISEDFHQSTYASQEDHQETWSSNEFILKKRQPSQRESQQQLQNQQDTKKTYNKFSIVKGLSLIAVLLAILNIYFYANTNTLPVDINFYGPKPQENIAKKNKNSEKNEQNITYRDEQIQLQNDEGVATLIFRKLNKDSFLIDFNLKDYPKVDTSQPRLPQEALDLKWIESLRLNGVFNVKSFTNFHLSGEGRLILKDPRLFQRHVVTVSISADENLLKVNVNKENLDLTRFFTLNHDTKKKLKKIIEAAP